MKNKNLRKVLSYYKNHKALLALAILITAIQTTAYLLMPFTLRFFVDDALLTKSKDHVIKSMVMYGGVVLVIVLFSFFQACLNKIINEKVANDVRLELKSSILNAKHTAFNKYDKGELLSYMVNDSKALAGDIATTLTVVFECIIRLIVSVTVLLQIDYKMLLFVLIFVPFYALDARIVNKPVKNTGKAVQSSNEEFTKHFEQMLCNRSSIIVNQEQGKHADIIKKVIQRLARRTTMNLVWQKTSFTLALCIYWTAIIVVYVIGGFRVVAELMTVGTVLFYVQYIDNIFMPCRQLVHASVEFQMAMTSAERILELQSKLGTRNNLKGKLVNNIRNLEVKELSFSYSEQSVFENINFKLTSGDILGVTGRSGIGKSTLIKVLSNLLENYKGRVNYNEHCLKEIKESSLYDQLSIVFQEPLVGVGMLKDQIDMSKVNDENRDFIDRLLSELPNGENTLIGESGSTISGGQKQRIALISQMISNKNILILDEPTASLDAVNKLEVKSIIKHLSQQGKIIILISHDSELKKIYSKELDLSAYVESIR